MRAKLILLIFFLFIMGIVLMGCGSSDSNNAHMVSSELLITEKTFPENFYELANQGVLVYKITNQDEFNEQWDNFRLSEKPSEIDWNNKTAIFLGTIESGSCPVEFDFVELDDEKTGMIIHFKVDSKVRACTDDATPRSIVFTLDADEASVVRFIEINNHYGNNPRVEL